MGVLGGGNKNNPDPLCGCYEWQPFNGMFHRNSRVRIADITDGTSNTVGVGERDNRFVLSSWAGVLPGAEVIYNPARGLGCQNSRPAITAVVVHSRQYTVNRPDASPAAFHTPAPRRRELPVHGRLGPVHQGFGRTSTRCGPCAPATTARSSRATVIEKVRPTKSFILEDPRKSGHAGA